MVRRYPDQITPEIEKQLHPATKSLLEKNREIIRLIDQFIDENRDLDYYSMAQLTGLQDMIRDQMELAAIIDVVIEQITDIPGFTVKGFGDQVIKW